MASQEPTFYLLKRRLAAQETQRMLGRVVLAFQDPTLSYTPESPAAVMPSLPSHIQQTFDHDVVLLANTSRDASLTAKLQGLLSMTTSSGAQNTASVEAPLVTTRRLKDLDTVWDALKADPAVAEKVEGIVKREGRAYLIMGIMTLRTGTVKRTGMRQQERDANATLPVGSVAAAAAGAPATGGRVEVGASQTHALDWSLACGVGRKDDETQQDEIFAVEYKMLKRDWTWTGRETRLQNRVPDYKGASTYAGASDEDDEEEEESASMLGVDGVTISAEVFYSGTVVAGQRPQLDPSKRFVYYA